MDNIKHDPHLKNRMHKQKEKMPSFKAMTKEQHKIIISILKGVDKEVEKILKKPENKFILMLPYPFGFTPIQASIEYKQTQIFTMLLEHMSMNYNMTTLEEDGTPLIIACIYNAYSIVEWLLQQKEINVHATNKKGRTALQAACINKNIAIINLLIAHKEHTHDELIDALHISNVIKYRDGFESILSVLEKRGVFYEICRENNPSLVYNFMSYPDSFAKVLIKQGFNVNIQFDEMLSQAINLELELSKSDQQEKQVIWNSQSYQRMVHNAEKMPYIRSGDTPSHIACKMGDLEKLQLLLHFGANPYLENNDGESPLFFALMGGHIEIIKLLLENTRKKIWTSKPLIETLIPLMVQYHKSKKKDHQAQLAHAIRQIIHTHANINQTQHNTFIKEDVYQTIMQLLYNPQDTEGELNPILQSIT